MAWITIIKHSEAKGLLKRQYDAAIKRAAKIWNIVSIMRQNPPVLKDSMKFYQTIMFGESPLSRSQREMLATVVSSANHCIYWIRSHANDLRVEVAKEIKDPVATDEFVRQIAQDWKKAGLKSADYALCEYAEKLTLTPAEMSEADIKHLLDLGFSQTAVHDAVQVISYFNYINRIADALDVDLEHDIVSWEQKL